MPSRTFETEFLHMGTINSIWQTSHPWCPRVQFMALLLTIRRVKAVHFTTRSNILLSPTDNKPFRVLVHFQKSKCKDSIRESVWYQRAPITIPLYCKTRMIAKFAGLISRLREASPGIKPGLCSYTMENRHRIWNMYVMLRVSTGQVQQKQKQQN
jgi:hypothetical protein